MDLANMLDEVRQLLQLFTWHTLFQGNYIYNTHLM